MSGTRICVGAFIHVSSALGGAPSRDWCVVVCHELPRDWRVSALRAVFSRPFTPGLTTLASVKSAHFMPGPSTAGLWPKSEHSQAAKKPFRNGRVVFAA
eukprot:365706-Chlamydomonas_euryale.AAC.16